MNPARPFPHEAIRASAGSGKTFQLAHRYIALLAAGEPADSLVALTFSRKAAGEIAEAIVGYLVAAASDETQARETARRIGRPDLSAADFLARLRELVRRIGRWRIGTLDSFAVGIVRAFPAELGLPGDLTLFDNEGVEALRAEREVLAEIFRRRPGDPAAQRGFLEAFKQATFGREERQIEATIESLFEDYRAVHRRQPDPRAWGDAARLWPGGPAGRTRLPDHAECRAAAQALKEWARSDQRLSAAVEKFADFAATYETFSAWRAIETSAVVRQLLAQRDTLPRGTVTYYKKDYPLTAAAGAAAGVLLQRLLGVELSRALENTRGIGALVGRFEERYEEQVRRRGRLTFEDLQRALARAGRLDLEYRLDGRLRHWLLDEFQDTSDLQWSLLENLVDEAIQDDSGRRSFFYVGDVKQAIYGWRGGNPRLFDRLLERYGAALRERPLDTSFRSNEPVIALVNRVFERLPETLPAAARERWAKLWRPHASNAGVRGLPGCAAALEVPREKQDAAGDARRRHDLAGALIRSLDPVRAGLSVAVLVRNNRDGAAAAAALRRACPGVPVVHEGRGGIFDNAVVPLLRALLRHAAHPGDPVAARHVAFSPLGAALDTEAPRDDRAGALLRDFTAAGAEDFLRAWGARLTAAHRLTPFERQRLDDLYAAARAFDAAGGGDTDAFLDHLDGFELRAPDAPAAVRVMTIHQAKGLGFDVVILPALNESQGWTAGRERLLSGPPDETGAPDWLLCAPRALVVEADSVLRAAAERAAAEQAFEELCVLYVALTRARHALYLVTTAAAETSEKLDAAAVVRATLAGPAETVEIGGLAAQRIYLAGDWTWTPGAGRESPAVPPPPAEGLSSVVARAAARRRRLRRVRPSAEAEARDLLAGALFAADARAGADRGTLLHALFERVEWAETTDLDAAAADWRRACAPSAELAEELERELRAVLAADETRAALARPPAGAELWREKNFDIALDRDWITGCFDRVTLERDAAGGWTAAHVLDYKSNLVETPADLDRLRDHYRPQMLRYRQVLSGLTGLPPERIRATLLFTRVARAVNVF